MNIFIYSDESGIFDQKHNTYFVFGGLIFLSKNHRDNEFRKYLNAEKYIRSSEGFSINDEVKASKISNSSKGKLFRSLNKVEKFGVVVQQKYLYESVFSSKKTKQRFLDWAFREAVRSEFLHLIRSQKIDPNEVENIFVFVDEHTTATDGIYELREAMEQELKLGMYTSGFSSFTPPIFPNLKHLDVKFCNSASTPLVRAADIVANKLYYLANNDKLPELKDEFNVIILP